MDSDTRFLYNWSIAANEKLIYFEIYLVFDIHNWFEGPMCNLTIIYEFNSISFIATLVIIVGNHKMEIIINEHWNYIHACHQSKKAGVISDILLDNIVNLLTVEYMYILKELFW